MLGLKDIRDFPHLQCGRYPMEFSSLFTRISGALVNVSIVFWLMFLNYEHLIR